MEQNAWNRYYPAGALASYREEPGSPVTLFTRSASRYPERNCLSFGSLTLSYAQTLDLVQRAAAGLQVHGLRKADRVALLLPNHPGFVIGYYAALQIGAVAVAINPLYPRS
ncbi:AMP-binding protein [Cupriavidus basilensis]